MSRAGPALAGSLSLFVPGAGHLVAGEVVHALFFSTSTAFMLFAFHAVVTMLDRILPTLELLGVAPAVAGGALACLLYTAAVLHVSAALDACSAVPGGTRSSPRPLLAGLASAIVPGWGQILLDHRGRAACFLGGTWLVAFAWLIVTPAGVGVLHQFGVGLSSGARDGWGPIALVTGTALLWALAIQDAVVGAIMRRRLD